MRVAIIGSREFTDYELMEEEIGKLNLTISVIISGGARGADSLAERYAKEYSLPIIVHLPDWSIGKHAGHIRNSLIIEDSDVVIAFWDGKSKGTLDSISKTRKYKKILHVINYNNRLSLL